MTVVFIGFAAVQYNDPDVFLWMGLYGLAALAGVLFYLGRLSIGAAVTLCGGSLAGALYLAARVLGRQPLFMEEGREMGGLIVVACWAGVLVFQLTRKSDSVPRTPVA
jgi:hypothetical protein